MQFKLFTATIAAMAVGSTIAGPVPVIDLNANTLATRDEQANQQNNAALAQQKANTQQQLQDINAAQKAAGKQVPTTEQMNQIKQEVATAQSNAQAQGKQWYPYYYSPDWYSYDLWDLYLPYYNLFGNTWNSCGYNWNTCNSWWW